MDMKIMNATFCGMIALLLMQSPVVLAGGVVSEIAPVGLRCEYLVSPLGIDVEKPRLSWTIADLRLAIAASGTAQSATGNQQSAMPRGLEQTAYQILVASGEELLAKDKGDLWDSGKVVGDQCNQIEYAGKPLESRMRCYWKVRVWAGGLWGSGFTVQGSAWSKPGFWTMGLLDPEAWKAKWIGLDLKDAIDDLKEAGRRRLPARYLRREFVAEKKIRRATAYVCGLGFFDLHINGKKIGNHEMDPILTEYNKRASYVTFDVTQDVKKGRNAVGVILGNGRFFAQRTRYKDYGAPRLIAQIEIENEDGTREQWLSDSQWRATADGPIVANNEYDGEEYDARKEMPGWNQAGFDDSKWREAGLLDSPKGKLVAQVMEPNRVVDVLKPVSLMEPKPGTWIVDFGQAFYGQVRIKVSGPAGTTLKISAAYNLKPDGTLKTVDNRNAECTDVYILKGQGQEMWRPVFKGQGFRRIQLTGWPGKPSVSQFEGLVVSTDIRNVGRFECSNPLINRIHRNIFWGARMFKRHGVPLDPDRDERQGWLGDPAKDAESDAFNFDVAAFYSKWVGDIRLDQREDGSIGNTSPNYDDSGDGILWPSVITIIPEWLYDFYGDRRALEENYQTIRKWMVFHQKRLEPDFTVSKDGFFADWCDTSTIGKGWPPSGSTAMPVLSTAYYFSNCRIAARLAKQLGRPADEKLFLDLGEKVKAGFNARFMKADGTCASDTQCAYVLVLKFGLVPQEMRDAVIAHLVADIMVKNKGHLSVGLIGMQWLMQTLTEIGRADVGYAIATQTTRPSWGYMIGKGATTIWERWDCDTQDGGMNSEALLILAGNLGAWFYQSLAGINYDPDKPAFKHIVMKPQPVGDLTFAKASFDSMYGMIRSDWRIDGGKFIWNVCVPPNTTATVYLPTTNEASVMESGKPAAKGRGMNFLKMENGVAVYEVGSGCYQFTSPIIYAAQSISH